MNETVQVEPSILEKSFNAPMKLVYEAWTQPKHLCNWQVPSEKFVCEYVRDDIRDGGSSLHKMTFPDGNEKWLLTLFKQLIPFHTIVFTQRESNKEGDLLPPSMPNWPEEIQATINLSESNGVTHMKFIWQPINPTKEQAEAFEASKSDHGKGWGGSFELLASYLEKQSN